MILCGKRSIRRILHKADLKIRTIKNFLSFLIKRLVCDDKTTSRILQYKSDALIGILRIDRQKCTARL